MDSIVQQTSNDQGYTKACSYCGVLRRQALNIGAERTHADLIATGHKATFIGSRDNPTPKMLQTEKRFKVEMEEEPWFLDASPFGTPNSLN